MSCVKEQPASVTLSGDFTGHYVVRQRRRGGQLVLDPEPTADEMAGELALQEASAEQVEAFLREHEREMLPPDHEG
jgi:hypothetical protein